MHLLLFFSLDDHNSFTSVEKYKAKIKEIKLSDNFPIILFGNKCDLAKSTVTLEEGMLKRESLSAHAYVQGSAVSFTNIDETFTELGNQCMNYHLRTTTRSIYSSIDDDLPSPGTVPPYQPPAISAFQPGVSMHSSSQNYSHLTQTLPEYNTAFGQSIVPSRQSAIQQPTQNLRTTQQQREFNNQLAGAPGIPTFGAPTGSFRDMYKTASVEDYQRPQPMQVQALPTGYVAPVGYVTSTGYNMVDSSKSNSTVQTGSNGSYSPNTLNDDSGRSYKDNSVNSTNTSNPGMRIAPTVPRAKGPLIPNSGTGASIKESPAPTPPIITPAPTPPIITPAKEPTVLKGPSEKDRKQLEKDDKKKQKEMEKEQKKKQKDDKKKKKHRPIEKESYNICILGPVNCGKTAIMKQFIEKIFQEEYQPSIADSYNKQIAVEKKTVALKITEIGGADMKNESTHKAIETNDCFILVYSIISLDSFMYTIDLHEQIVKIKVNPRVPIFIFANKNDLETKREVMDIDVKKLCFKN